MGPGEHILAVGRAPFAPRRVLSRRAAWRLLVAVLFVALTGCGNESAHRDARDTAQAMGPPQTDAFAGIDPSRWLARQGALQTTTLDAANVTAGAGGLRIAAQANGLHGGELQARQLTGPGWYAWHAKLPELPGSLTGMFLYRTPDGQSELDIELPNDSSGSCWLTSWGRGTRLGSRTVALPFDPTKGVHEYAIAWLGAKTTFYVDGQPVATLPSVSRAMYMMTNVWFPDWLDTPPAAGATGTLTVSRVTRPTP